MSSKLRRSSRILKLEERRGRQLTFEENNSEDDLDTDPGLPNPKLIEKRKTKHVQDLVQDAVENQVQVGEQQGDQDKHRMTAAETIIPETSKLQLLISNLQRIDTYGVFSEPVKPEEVEGYYEVIKEPMDFSTMSSKLNQGSYKTIEDVEHDVFLVTNNAMYFNASTSIYYRQARKMKALAKELFQALRDNPAGFENEFSITKPRSRRTVEACTGEAPGSRNKKVADLVEEEPRATYRPSSESKSTVSRIYNRLQPLEYVSRGQFGYRKSLMSFVKDLGPTAQMVARRKLKPIDQLQQTLPAQREAPSSVGSTLNPCGNLPANSHGDASFKSQHNMDEQAVDRSWNLVRKIQHGTSSAQKVPSAINLNGEALMAYTNCLNQTNSQENASFNSQHNMDDQAVDRSWNLERNIQCGTSSAQKAPSAINLNGEALMAYAGCLNQTNSHGNASFNSQHNMDEQAVDHSGNVQRNIQHGTSSEQKAPSAINLNGQAVMAYAGCLNQTNHQPLPINNNGASSTLFPVWQSSSQDSYMDRTQASRSLHGFGSNNGFGLNQTNSHGNASFNSQHNMDEQVVDYSGDILRSIQYGTSSAQKAPSAFNVNGEALMAYAGCLNQSNHQPLPVNNNGVSSTLFPAWQPSSQESYKERAQANRSLHGFGSNNDFGLNQMNSHGNASFNSQHNMDEQAVDHTWNMPKDIQHGTSSAQKAPSAINLNGEALMAYEGRLNQTNHRPLPVNNNGASSTLFPAWQPPSQESYMDQAQASQSLHGFGSNNDFGLATNQINTMTESGGPSYGLSLMQAQSPSDWEILNDLYNEFPNSEGGSTSFQDMNELNLERPHIQSYREEANATLDNSTFQQPLQNNQLPY